MVVVLKLELELVPPLVELPGVLPVVEVPPVPPVPVVVPVPVPEAAELPMAKSFEIYPYAPFNVALLAWHI